jgi:sugar lactone lactonase YvrE
MLSLHIRTDTSDERKIILKKYNNHLTTTSQTYKSIAKIKKGIAFGGIILTILSITLVGLNYLSLKDTKVNALINGANAVDQMGQSLNNDNVTQDYTSNNVNDQVGKYSLFSPKSIAIDTVRNRMFVADSNNYRILVYDLNASNVLVDNTPDYVLGQSDFRGGEYNGVSATSLGVVNSLSVDSTGGRLFVADGSYRVLIFDINTIVNNEAAVNVLGQPTLTSTVFGGVTQSKFSNSAFHVQYDSVDNNLYVADIGNSRVLVFNMATVTNGMNAAFVLGQPDFISNSENLSSRGMSNPGAMAIDSFNRKLFLNDVGNSRVMIYDITTIVNNEAIVYVIGASTISGAPYATVSMNGLTGLTGIVFESSGRVYISQNSNRVSVFDMSTYANGKFAISVLGQSNFTTSTASVSQAGLTNPNGLAITAGKLFVVNLNRISIFDVLSITDGENAVGLLGQWVDKDGVTPNYTSSTSNYGTNKHGFYFGQYSTGTIDYINHRMFVPDSNNYRILVYNLNTSDVLIDKIPDYVLGQVDFVSKVYTAPSSSTIGIINSLAFDPTTQYLYVAEGGTINRITVFDVSTITNNESAIYVLGNTNFTSYNSTVSSTANNSYASLAIDVAGRRLFTANNNSNRVSVFNITSLSNGMGISNILGQTLFTNTTSGTTATTLALPTGLAFDSVNNRLYVSDNFNSRVLVYDTASITNGEAAINVLGQTDFVSSTSGTTQSKLDTPQNLEIDTVARKLYVSDSSNRILVYDITSVTNGMNASGVIGQTDFVTSSVIYSQSTIANIRGIFLNKTTKNLLVANGSRLSFFDTADNNAAVEFSSATTSSTNETTGGTMPKLLINGVVLTAQSVQVYVSGGSATGSGTDYSYTTQTVNIPAATYDGTNATAITITAPTLSGDSTVEGNETIIYGLQNPTSGVTIGDANSNSTTQSVFTFTITEDDYSVAYTAGAGGTITGSTTQVVTSGNNASSVTAVPNVGYTFTNWSDGVTTAARTDTNITANKTATANFAINTYAVTYTAGSGGTLTGVASQTINHGANASTVTAVPNVGYTFTNWSDGVTTAARTDTNIIAIKNVTANFGINTYAVTYTAGSGGTLTGTASQTINHGSNASTVTAVPNVGYTFTNWSDGVTTAARTDTNITANKTATANFAINTYAVTYTAGSGGTLTGTASQTINHGANASTVTAVPNSGYHFGSWSDGVTTAARTDTNITAIKNVTANFIINTTPTITSINSTTANGSYKVGDTISVQINFTENVSVTGTPTLILETGTIDRSINYTSGTGTQILTFNYTVQSGDTSSDLDYTATTALSGIINSSSYGQIANLALPAPAAANSLGSNKSIIIDTTSPTITNITSTLANGTYRIGVVVPIQVSFSENVVVTGTPALLLETGTLDRNVNYVSGSGTPTLLFNYTVGDDDVSSDLDYNSNTALSGVVKDIAGNSMVSTLPAPGATNSLSSNKNIIIDGIVPRISSINLVNTNGTYKVGDTITINVVMSSLVTVTGTPTLGLSLGSSTNRTATYTSGSGTNTMSFSYTIQLGDFTTDLDYTGTNALTVTTGSVLNSVGNPANLTLAVPGTAGSLSNNYAIYITDDADSDGVKDVDEVITNGGDANADGIQDYLQNTVVTKPNTLTTGTSTLQTSGVCSQITGFGVGSENTLAVSDAANDYNYGIFNFNLTCTAPGGSGVVKLYIKGNIDTAKAKVQKIKGTLFNDITNIVTFGSQTIGGTLYTTISYTVTDGGVLDSDGIVDSHITDPVGISTPAPILAVTGNELGKAFGMLFLVIGLMCLVLLKNRKSHCEARSNPMM